MLCWQQSVAQPGGEPKGALGASAPPLAKSFGKYIPEILAFKYVLGLDL